MVRNMPMFPRSTPANQSAGQRSQRKWPQIRCAPANGCESPDPQCSGTCQCSPFDTREPGGRPKISTRMAANPLRSRECRESPDPKCSGTCHCSRFDTREPVGWPKISTRMAANGRKSAALPRMAENLAKVNGAEHANVPPFDTREPVDRSKISTQMAANPLRSRE